MVYDSGFSSAINILFGIDQVQEAILIGILLVDIFQLGIWSHHVSLMGKQHQAFLSIQLQSLSQDGQHLTHTERLRHHKSTRKNIWVNNWEEWMKAVEMDGETYFGLEMVLSVDFSLGAFSMMSASLDGNLSMAC